MKVHKHPDHLVPIYMKVKGKWKERWYCMKCGRKGFKNAI